jgi:hypothetical protein
VLPITSITATPQIVKAILDLAKRSSRILAESEILEVVRGMNE